MADRLLLILIDTPLWVWGLLAFLVLLGVLSLRTRPVPVAAMVVLPLLFFATSIANFFPLDALTPLRIGVWVAAFVAGAVPGWFAVRPQRVVVDRARRLITIPGSVVPLVLLLVSFACGFYFFHLFGRYPQMQMDPTARILDSTYRGLISGFFSGQLLRYFRLYFTAPQSTVST